jgi:hypothetical protein
MLGSDYEIYSPRILAPGRRGCGVGEHCANCRRAILSLPAAHDDSYICRRRGDDILARARFSPDLNGNGW